MRNCTPQDKSVQPGEEGVAPLGTVSWQSLLLSHTRYSVSSSLMAWEMCLFQWNATFRQDSPSLAESPFLDTFGRQILLELRFHPHCTAWERDAENFQPSRVSCSLLGILWSMVSESQVKNLSVILGTQVKWLLGHHRWPKRVNWIIISQLSGLREAVKIISLPVLCTQLCHTEL